MSVRRWTAAVTCAVTAGAGALVAVASVPTATAAELAPVEHASHDRIVSAVPASWTPQIKDGKVFTIAQTGNTMVVGGSFTQVSLASGAGLANRQNIVAFNATTGAIIGAFNPTIAGSVNAVEAGPTSDTIYVGGSFSSVNGVPGKVVLMNVNTGQVLASFRAPGMNGAVQDIVKAGNRLYIGGSFTSVGNTPHGGLVTLNATTGVLDPYMNVHLTEHHNYTGQNGEAVGAVGAKAIDITPDGRWLIAGGNFKKANGLDRDQLVMVDLAGATAEVRADWRTRRMEPRCAYWAFDSYLRDVKFSPDGNYFTLVSTGAPFPGTLCDTTTRFGTAATGQDVQPDWIQDTGGDSLYSVGNTGVAVYAGGHQRWHNNAGGRDGTVPGAVPRPGIGGFDARSGVPVEWNPGRQPRGAGAEAMFVSPAGLWVGSDTNYIGNNEYWRPRLAFFPVAGGKVLGPGAMSQLPANIYLAPESTLTRTLYDGTNPPPAPSAAPDGGINWNNVRGAMVVDGELFYNSSDGNFHRRTFDGTTYGPDQLIDPYTSTEWTGVPTGSGSSVYTGRKPSYYSEISSIRGLAYRDQKLYYTRTGSSSLFRRDFSLDSGILTQATSTVPGFSVANVSGIFFSGSSLYFTNSVTGNLSRIGWSNGAPTGSATVLSGPGVDGRDWRARTIFSGPGPGAAPPNVAPTAVISDPDCTALSCQFSGSGSTDPDGTIASYAWNFGDNSTGSGPNPTHTYAAPGTYQVRLTVTDDDDATGTVVRSVTVSSTVPGDPQQFVAVAASTANTTAATVTVPAGVQTGDTLLLFATANSLTPVSAPSGAGSWVTERRQESFSMATDLYSRVAGAGDAGSVLTLTSSGTQKIDLQLLVYRGGPADPVGQVASAADASTASHVTPSATVAADGTTAVSFWADKSSTTTDWTPPAGVTVRSEQIGAGSGRVTTLVADAVVPDGTASFGGLTATTDQTSSRGATFTVLLPAGG